MSKGARKALDRDASFPFAKTTAKWKAYHSTLGGIADWQELYEVLRDTYEELQDIYVPSSVVVGLSQDHRDRLERVEQVITPALVAIDAEIEKTVSL